MRKSKIIVWVIVCLVLCVFVVIPAVRLASGQNKVTDQQAQLHGETLTLTVRYGSGGEFFEIGRDIVVATDKDFTQTLRMKMCKPVDGDYVYEFDAANVNELNTIYVQAPILYMPVEITPVSVPAVKGRTAKMSESDTELETAGSNWFFVDSVSIAEAAKGSYSVKIVVAAEESKDLPRLPKLVNGETEIGGVSALHFDENSNFDSGEFLFDVNAGSEAEAEQMVAASSLLVGDAMIRVDTKDLTITPSVKSLSVVVVE